MILLSSGIFISDGMASVIAVIIGIQSPSGLQLIHGNRTDLKHVAKIKEAMKRGEIVPPIIIDKLTKLIIDGQHTLILGI